MSNQLFISGSHIFYDSLQYSSYLGLPGSESLPTHWINPVGEFTTRNEKWLEVLKPGEMVYSGESLLNLSHLQTGHANFSFIINFMSVRDLKFELRLRRLDDQNFIALEVDYENQSLAIKKMESGISTVLNSMPFKWNIYTSAYGVELWTFEDRIEGHVNKYPFITATSSFNMNVPGISLYVPELWDNNIPRFYKIWVYDVDEYPDPQLETSTDLLLLERKKLKQAIENPTSYTWATFTESRKNWEKGKDYGKTDAEWSFLGYPIREPYFEKWYQNM